MVDRVSFIDVEIKLGAIMLIGAKINRNHYLILFFIYEKIIIFFFNK
jgi:hypothetical protein